MTPDQEADAAFDAALRDGLLTLDDCAQDGFNIGFLAGRASSTTPALGEEAVGRALDAYVRRRGLALRQIDRPAELKAMGEALRAALATLSTPASPERATAREVTEPHHTMTLTLTDVEMKALEELEKLRGLSKPQVYRQALRLLYQLQAIEGWDTPRRPDDRLKAPPEAREVTDGWVTLPRDPSREMWAAMGNALVGYKQRHHDKVAEELWQALLAAAPKPPTPEAAGAALSEVEGLAAEVQRLDRRNAREWRAVHGGSQWSYYEDAVNVAHRLADALERAQ